MCPESSTLGRGKAGGKLKLEDAIKTEFVVLLPLRIGVIGD
jgi:hypothetical protein